MPDAELWVGKNADSTRQDCPYRESLQVVRHGLPPSESPLCHEAEVVGCLRPQQVEHAFYEADLAKLRYDRVDPENRFVSMSWATRPSGSHAAVLSFKVQSFETRAQLPYCGKKPSDAVLCHEDSPALRAECILRHQAVGS